MSEDPKTRSLLLAVMDGHGEDGDKVSQHIKGKLANYLFKHPDFATDIQAAFLDVIARVESEVLKGFIYVIMFPFLCFSSLYILESSIETDFSGTTFTAAVIRDNKITMANVGDSRTSIGFRNENGGISSINLTIDHKPDLPAEKVS